MNKQHVVANKAFTDANPAAAKPYLILRPGPRVTEGVERLARAIHPELFATRETP